MPGDQNDIQELLDGVRGGDRQALDKLYARYRVEQGLFCRTGTGRRNDLYRYWLPGLEAQLHPSPGAGPQETERWRHSWETKNLQRLLDLASGSPAESPAAASVPAKPQPEAVVEAPVVAAAQAAAEPGVSASPSLSPCEGTTGDRSAALPVGGPAAPWWWSWSRSSSRRHPSLFRRAWPHLVSCCPRLLYLRKKRQSGRPRWNDNADECDGGHQVEGHAN